MMKFNFTITYWTKYRKCYDSPFSFKYSYEHFLFQSSFQFFSFKLWHEFLCMIMWNKVHTTQGHMHIFSGLESNLNCLSISKMFLLCCIKMWLFQPSRSGRVRHGWLWVRGLNIQCVWTCLQVHGLKRLCCHADLYTISKCHNRGESEDHIS